MNWPLLIVVLITLCVPLVFFAFVRLTDRNTARNEEHRRTGIGHTGD